MSEEPAQKNTIEDVLELLRQLRYIVSDFQESIDAFFANNEEWQGIKSRLVLFEARFASLEVRLSSVAAKTWASDDIDFMLKELKDIGDDIVGMRHSFIQVVEKVSERVM